MAEAKVNDAAFTACTAFTTPPRSAHPQRAAFLDRDGVINIDHGYTGRVADFQFVPGALEACAALHDLGLALVVVTNQSGIGRGRYSVADFLHLTDWMQLRFAEAQAPLAAVYYCPHHPTDALPAWQMTCGCRKPAPGMFLQAAHDLQIDMAASVMFGDRVGDLQAAQAAGVGLRIRLTTNGVDSEAADAGAVLGPGMSAAHQASAHAAISDSLPATPPLAQGHYATLAAALSDATLRLRLAGQAPQDLHVEHS